MKGLIIKDLLNLKKTLKFVLVFIALFGILLFTSTNSSGFIGIVILLSTMMVITTMSYDELAKWDNYALTMPITRKDIVLSKYLVMIILSFAGAFIGLVLSILLNIFKSHTPVSEIALVSLLVLSFAIIIGSILFPLLYKFGAEKARLLIICFSLLFTICIVFGGTALKSIDINTATLNTLLNSFIFSSPLVAIVVLFFSYIISVKIYSKKDM